MAEVKMVPNPNDTLDIGTSSKPIRNIVANNIKGALNGTATYSNYLKFSSGNEINFGGGNASLFDDIYINYRPVSGDTAPSNTIVKYNFCNYRNGVGPSVVVAGSFNGNLTGTASSAYYSDLAEFFPRGEETEVGDIIALDELADEEKYIKATEKSICVVGVHSESYGFVMGGKDSEDKTKEGVLKANLPKYIPVGLAGRVNVKFKGVSHKGVRVVPSDEPGVGRAFDAIKDDRDSIVGYLVESDNKDGIRLLKMKIK